MRERLSSRLGFILLSAGCAIGIGNVWRFPYVCGQSGGLPFVALYLVFLVVLGIPVMVMEFAAGRAARRSVATLHEALLPGRRTWRMHGIAGIVGCFMLMMFYTTVAGWMVIYFCRTAAGAFDGMDASAIGNAFGEMLGDWRGQSVAMFGVVLGCAAVCALGVQKGLASVTKWMMLALLGLIVVLAVNSCRLPGAGQGVAFYLLPDSSSWSRLAEIGVGTTVVNAMTQAFFTLSLGIGCMAIFGSYIDRAHSLLGESVTIAALDTFVALMAGLIVIPACFAYGVDQCQGPGLVFVTLPNVFNHMPDGRFWGACFFLFMSFAALSTVLTVFESIIAALIECTGWGRRLASFVLAVVMPLLSLPCILGFNAWSAFHPLGAGSNILDLEDFIVSDILLPLGSLAFALFCCHRYGWGWKKFLAEANAGRGIRFPAWLRPYCAYVLPLVIVFVFVVAIVRRFA